MADNKNFWMLNNLCLLAFYAWAGFELMQVGGQEHPAVWMAAIVLVAHVLELPLAFKVLKQSNWRAGVIVPMTVLFGFTWWLPAKRGVYTPG